MREQQQQHARAEGQRRGERAEGSGQHLGEGVHPAVPEARKDTRRNVQETHDGGGPADERGDGLGARTAEYAAHPRGSTRNLARHFPIYPDRHRIP
ncbi:hypothetical protein GCM10014715_73960 [Streptomyces spiralis]|uniref:Uncharacterized protein n=1 Tax=Streptomyces spiralis TaxID=66376 RepID=A0A919AI66_9ACTN|nr:hypothetical protein GCM10014715_73960 [Streptomyces spiralis]